jgi:hypothetical protein
VGSGPFKFKGYTRGSTFEGSGTPDYFIKDRPYLDGYKFYISPRRPCGRRPFGRARAYIEFRNLPNADVEAIRKQLGTSSPCRKTPMTGQWGIAINTTPSRSTTCACARRSRWASIVHDEQGCWTPHRLKFVAA